MVGWAYFSTLGYTIILFLLSDKAIKIRLTSKEGAITGAIAHVGMAVGRPTVGLLSDHAGQINVAGGATFLAGIFCLCAWTSATSYGVLLAFSFLAGTVLGTYYAVCLLMPLVLGQTLLRFDRETVSPLLADVTGINILPAALSIIWTVIVLPATFAEPIALALRRKYTPFYLDVQIFAGCRFIGGAVCMALLRHWMIKRTKR